MVSSQWFPFSGFQSVVSSIVIVIQYGQWCIGIFACITGSFVLI